MRALPVTVLLLLILASAPLSVSGQETAVQAGPSSFSITTQTSDAYVSDDPGPEVVYDGLPKQGGDALILRSYTCAPGETDPTPGAEIDIEFSLVTDAGANVGFRIVYEIQFVTQLSENTTDAYVRVYIWDYGQAAWEQLDELILSYPVNDVLETNRSFSSDYMSGSGTVKVRLHTGHDVQNCDAYAEASAYEFVIQLDDDSQSNGTTGPDDEGGPVTPDEGDAGEDEPDPRPSIYWDGPVELVDLVVTLAFYCLFITMVLVLVAIIGDDLQGLFNTFRRKWCVNFIVQNVLGTKDVRELTLSDRSVSTKTQAFAGRMKEGSGDFRVAVVKQGRPSNIRHLVKALENQYGGDYFHRRPIADNPALILAPIFRNMDGTSIGLTRHLILGYRDLVRYEAVEPKDVPDHDAPGRVSIRAGTPGLAVDDFLFGRVDGKILYNLYDGNIEEIEEICKELIKRTVDFSRSGGVGTRSSNSSLLGSLPAVLNPIRYLHGTAKPPSPSKQPPSKLSWLEVSQTSRHRKWLEAKKRKTRGVLHLLNGAKNKDYNELASKYRDFLKKTEPVHRIHGISMHGDCRAANWVWWMNGLNVEYAPIDFMNYIGRFTGKKGNLGIYNKASVGSKGEEIEWIRPFLFGHWDPAAQPDEENQQASPDEYPDPLFDLAEMMASILLDIWVDPDPIVEVQMGRKSDEFSRIFGENLLCSYWKDPQSRHPVIPPNAAPHHACYSQIIVTFMSQIEEWIESLDTRGVPATKRDTEPTKRWFSYAVADRLIYKACLISNKEARYEIGEGADTTTTVDIAVKMALYFVNNEYSNLLSSAPSSPPPPDEEEDDEKGPEPVKAGPRNAVNWGGDIVGPASITIIQDSQVTVGKEPRQEESTRGSTTPSPPEPGTKVWATLDDGQLKFAVINQVREPSGAEIEGEFEMDINTHVTGSENTEDERITVPEDMVSRRLNVIKSNRILRHFFLPGAPRFEQGQTVYIEDLDRASEFDLPPIEERNPLSFGRITHFYLCPHRNQNKRRIIVEVLMDHTDELRLYPIERLHLPDI